MITAPAAGAATSRSRPEMQAGGSRHAGDRRGSRPGTSQYQTWAAGSQGNDRPFQVVNETWFSPDLKEMVLSKTIDPRSGENTTKLINISRNEPSAGPVYPARGLSGGGRNRAVPDSLDLPRQ